MTLDTWFEKGIAVDEYIQSMKKHKENTLSIYDQFQIPDSQALFQPLQERGLRAIILTEDWCGDAMLNLPIFYRIAEAADIDTRILLRDSNLELMDQYLTNGKSRSIPIIIFIDENGEEIGKWGPRADTLQTFLDESFSSLPDKNAPEYEEKRNQMLTFITKSFHDNQDFWTEVYNSMKNTLLQLK